MYFPKRKDVYMLFLLEAINTILSLHQSKVYDNLWNNPSLYIELFDDNVRIFVIYGESSSSG